MRGSSAAWSATLHPALGRLPAPASNPASPLALLPAALPQADYPLLGGTSEQCPHKGPEVVPAKRRGHGPHAHALLAPSHTFAEWVEAHTLSWGEHVEVRAPFRAAACQGWERGQCVQACAHETTAGAALRCRSPTPPSRPSLGRSGRPRCCSGGGFS